MKCKYCQAELEDGMNVCPVCGKEQEEISAQEVAAETAAQEIVEEAPVQEPAAETATEEAKETATEIKEGIKATPGKIALAIAAGVGVLALLVALVVSGLDGNAFKGTEETLPTEAASVVETEAAEPATEGTIPPDGNPEDVTCKGSYSVTTEDLNASRDTVVAVIGDEELTVGELQIYYWEAIFAFESELGSYASQFGLDFTHGLDTQLCSLSDVSMTWQQYFLDYALNVWHQHQAVALAGKAAGHEITEAYQKELDNLPTMIQQQAEYYGAEDVESWIQNYVGPGCTVDDFINYMRTYYQGIGYLEDLEKNTTFTAEEVEAYFAENEAVYADGGIAKESGKTVDVRHILLMPEGGTTDETGKTTYSEDEWEACRGAAQEILDQWLAGEATEDAFADLANTHSTDPGSNTNGGLYSYVTEGQMVPAFNDWCFDESRQYGDSGLVKTEYGYHIMFFVKSQDIWYVTAEQDMISEKVSAMMPAAMEKHPMTVDYSAIKLGNVEFSAG